MPQRERAGRAGGSGGGGDGPDRGGARRPGRPHPGAYTLVNTDTQAVVVVVVVVVVARRTGRPHPGWVRRLENRAGTHYTQVVKYNAYKLVES